MKEEKQYFGYGEEQIRKIFRNGTDQTDSNSRIEETPTLSQLAESSGRLLKENKDFLYMIYNDLDE